MSLSTPPWLYLLTLDQRDWREDQRATGANPDAFIARHLFERGVWPAANAEGGPWRS